jgi:thioredoxin reductase (NADPH)
METEKTIIIGAGPAGIAAAIQLRRQGINPVIFEKSEIGGLLRNADLVENYPGFPGGISGGHLVSLFKKQLRAQLLEVVFEEVTSLDFKDGMFIVETPERVCHSRTVMVASGTKARKFTDFEIPENVKARVFYEVYPVLEATGKKVVIVGAGDAAFDYALNLGKRNEVVILNRGESVRCLPLLSERVKKSGGIGYCKRTKIVNITDDSSEGLLLECTSPEKTSILGADYLIFAIGRHPQLDFLSERLKGEIQKLESRGLLYFVGDVRNRTYRQTAIAIGEGIMAAMRTSGKLQEVTL